jgi:hypothetical protein
MKSKIHKQIPNRQTYTVGTTRYLFLVSKNMETDVACIILYTAVLLRNIITTSCEFHYDTPR